MNRILPTLLLLLLVASALTSCLRNPAATSSITTSADTTTTLRMRPVKVHVSADSVTTALDLKTFQDSLAAAKPGEVIRSGLSKSGRTSYALRKTSTPGQPLAFAVDVRSRSKDTIVQVTDTTRVIHLERKEVVVMPSATVKAAKTHHSMLFYLVHPKQLALDYAYWLWLLLAIAAGLMVRRVVKAL